MSTIASPRDPSTPLGRRVSVQALTPTSSSRPSLDTPRSATASPNLSQPGIFPGKRANRAALREYYNLKKQAGPGSAAGTPVLEVTDPLGDSRHETSDIAPSELDEAEFDAEDYVRRALGESSLEELLKLYTRVLGETRALDAEKKALVYDNYSKLISATETIRKMRKNMDPLNPMASTLDPAIAQIYSQASSIRESLRKTVPPPDSEQRKQEDVLARQRRTRDLAREVLATPERLRKLVAEGKMGQARKEWETPRRLLEMWKEKGLGGKDVFDCLEEGDAVLRGEKDSDSGRSSKDSR